MNPRTTRTLALAAASTLLLGGHATASPIVVLNDGAQENLIISRGEYRIRIFQDSLDIVLTPTPGDEPPNSIFVNFQMLGTIPDKVIGAIGGNWVPPFPPLPLQTPSIYVPGGLRLEGMTLGVSTDDYVQPSYDPEFGDTRPAYILHGSPRESGDFDIESFSDDPNNKTAFIGFADSEVSMFGYMQIERVNLLDWKLIGYAYDPTGAPIEVERLVIPGSSAFGLLAAPLLTRPKRRVVAYCS